MTGARHLSIVLLMSLETACAHVETAPGVQLTAADADQLSLAVNTAAFWYPSCARSQIVVQRDDDNRMMAELSVCGEVRRYQRIRVPGSWDTWLDVTRSTDARPAPPG